MKNRPWTTDSRFPILWSQWDKGRENESSVIYHMGTGDTHQLDVLSAMILQIVESGPVSTNELARRLSTQSGLDADDDFYLYIENTLSRFQQLNLISHAV
ncbi:MAG: HPr-rel-A system PqqD family peptide chaperone [Gammaproteobacteria bacterium]|nr:HPr-rel-A system PqqD family peptide chaperone [Gammaproteobacteria bacterium]